ncbi:Pentapeptide repeats (9 copies) [Xylophilus ampelinus]|nr:Pentapeptide repeats (9 copies) [Xylophilus ampelinus]|tara:strand:+ start:931 stop:1152 length:222 start_codon:yes stop_codon:yes gene_type:complete
MAVKGALFSGASFQYLTWKNIKFVDCDFSGAYEIKLHEMENCSFENCKIVGIHGFGTMRNVQFHKCLLGGASV